MPKLIDYPRTSYTSAWEVAEVVDDTGGKCALETCARKLNRKVSGSFKAIVGSAVKFGLLTSKRELLATTTLFRRIKHAYDKQEEMVFHREAFLTPPLFTQLCRKFRARELPVAMLDVLLMREFSVEEINAQAVAKAFIDGARMVHLLDEQNLIADIDQLAAQQPPRRELASPPPPNNIFRQQPQPLVPASDEEEAESTDTLVTEGTDDTEEEETSAVPTTTVRPSSRSLESRENSLPLPASRPAPAATTDAIANLFGLGSTQPTTSPRALPAASFTAAPPATTVSRSIPTTTSIAPTPAQSPTPFRIQLTGPGMNTELDVVEVEDLALIRALLDKIERQLKR
ncbi:MAG: hypothetical protein ACRYG7_31290 [Janthinobacterium lividum]